MEAIVIVLVILYVGTDFFTTFTNVAVLKEYMSPEHQFFNIFFLIARIIIVSLAVILSYFAGENNYTGRPDNFSTFQNNQSYTVLEKLDSNPDWLILQDEKGEMKLFEGNISFKEKERFTVLKTVENEMKFFPAESAKPAEEKE